MPGTKRRTLMLMAALFLLAAPSYAQESGDVSDALKGVADAKQQQDALLDPNLYVGIQEAYQRTLKMRGEPEIRPQQIKTLFFTRWQHALLQEAKRGFWTRRPDEYELSRSDTPEVRVRGPREIALGGIVYTASEDWVVWLNGQRLTPDAIPKQVMDIRVGKDYIELKWYDSWTNLIFPVRLRTHQRFNLDSRIFLPGPSAL